MIPRKEDYRLLTMHGVVQPRAGCEARIRNDLYLIGELQLNYSNSSKVKVRLVGYELPLQEVIKRGTCIDLFGYDENYNPYIIELKKGTSTEKLPKVMRQINDYEYQLIPLIGYIENEIRAKLHWDKFKLTSNIKKIILAPREYFNANPAKGMKDESILFCSFSRLRTTDALIKQRNGKGFTEIMIYNK